jgi:hypothetical protein
MSEQASRPHEPQIMEGPCDEHAACRVHWAVCSGCSYDWAIANRIREADSGYFDVVFDGPPSHEAGRFVEVEDASGASIRMGDWLQREDGYWVLRIPRPRAPRAFPAPTEQENT